MNRIADLSSREKIILMCGIAFVILFFGIRLGIAPVLENRRFLRTMLNVKQTALEEMQQLQQQYAAVSTALDVNKKKLAERKPGFSLFSFLDHQAQQTGIKQNVAYMQPSVRTIEDAAYSVETVKCKLTRLYLKELVAFLYQIESSHNDVTITALSLKKAGKDNGRLDVVIEAETLIKKDN